MEAWEISLAAKAGHLLPVENVDPNSAMMIGEHLAVSGFVALRVQEVSRSLSRDFDLEVSDQNGTSFGTLCLVRGRSNFQPSSATAWQYISYLADAEVEETGQDAYHFKNDYLVVDQSFLDDYVRDYLDGAPLWGGFHHGRAESPRISPSQITAFPRVRLPTTHHQLSFARVVRAASSSDQFLKLYHTIELIFDFVSYKKIVQCGDDLRGFGKILSSYNSKELERLRSVMRDLCSDANSIAAKLMLARPFADQCKEMFQEFGKEGNPFNDETKWNKFWELVENGNVSENGCKDKKLIVSSSDFVRLVIAVSSYWIYRMRSSIAHSRVGEFLLEETHDRLLEEFGVPLMLEIARQVFSGEELASLMN